jgi:hypothetical protein
MGPNHGEMESYDDAYALKTHQRIWWLNLHTKFKKRKKRKMVIMYPKLGILDPSFTKTGDKMRSQDENGTQDKN